MSTPLDERLMHMHCTCSGKIHDNLRKPEKDSTLEHSLFLPHSTQNRATHVRLSLAKLFWASLYSAYLSVPSQALEGRYISAYFNGRCEVKGCLSVSDRPTPDPGDIVHMDGHLRGAGLQFGPCTLYRVCRLPFKCCRPQLIKVRSIFYG